MTDWQIPMSREAAAHLAKSERRAMAKMAVSLGLDPESYATPELLWDAIREATIGGVMHPDEVIIGDPWAVFVTTRCAKCQAVNTFVWKTPNGHRATDDEREGFVRHLKGQGQLTKCPECLATLNGHSVDSCRMSTFGAGAKS